MSKLAEQLVARLLEKHYTISMAETCTGGLMASEIVSVPHASHVFNASVVVYSNESKIRYTHVSEDTLKTYGAVSEQTAIEMAKGIAEANHADIGAAITGITGPGGGTPDKPVGTMCFGFVINGRTVSSTQSFGNIGRDAIRLASVELAMVLLLRLL